MSIGRICQREVDLAEAEESVSRAAKRMFERGVGTLVIVNHVRVPIGILTDRDIVLRVVAHDKDPHKTLVSEVMTPYPKVISERAPIESGLKLMGDGGFRRLPVVDHEGRLMGLVALDDMLQLLAEEFRQIGPLLKRTSPSQVA